MKHYGHNSKNDSGKSGKKRMGNPDSAYRVPSVKGAKKRDATKAYEGRSKKTKM